MIVTTADLRAGAPTLPADTTVVIGAGAAGLALALALGDAGGPVLLLESGDDSGRPAAPDVQDLNEGSSTGHAYRGLAAGRTRALGGTTALWHGQCMRLHEHDLAPRPWVAGSGWPIDLTELDPHYTAAEAWLGVSGRGYDGARWAEHGRLRPLPWDPERLLHDFTEYTPVTHLGAAHRRRLVAHPHVRLALRATVARVLLSGNRLNGVEVAEPGGTRTAVRATRVVLAAGAVENARLLQLSDPEQVGLGLGRVHTGRYLQDHPVVTTAEVVAPDHRVLQDRYISLYGRSLTGRGTRLFPKVRLAPAAQERYGLLDATAVFVHEHDDTGLAAARRLVHAARSHSRPERPGRDGLLAARAVGPVLRRAYRRYARGVAGGGRPDCVRVQVWLEQAPDRDRRITLAAERDAYGLPRAQVHWGCADQEIETSRALTRFLDADLRRLGVGELRALPPMHDDDAWRADAADAYHPSGTTRMAVDPSDGVVDPDLQVHGVPGLHVVGASVFPASGYANPTLTIVALALRLAGRMRRSPAGVAR